MQYPKCQHENFGNLRFCNACGHALPKGAGISGEPLKTLPHRILPGLGSEARRGPGKAGKGVLQEQTIDGDDNDR